MEDNEHSEDDGYIFSIGSKGRRPQTEIKLNGQAICVLIDSGAEVNLIDQATFGALSNRPQLEPGGRNVFPYQSDKPIHVRSQFKAVVHSNGHSTEASFKVVDGHSGNLLSFETARKLDLFATEAFQRPDNVSVIDQPNKDYVKLAKEFSDVVTDRVGLLKNHPVRFHIDKTVPSVKSVYRRHPYHMVKAIDVELDRMIGFDIIEPVNEPVIATCCRS